MSDLGPLFAGLDCVLVIVWLWMCSYMLLSSSRSGVVLLLLVSWSGGNGDVVFTSPGESTGGGADPLDRTLA